MSDAVTLIPTLTTERLTLRLPGAEGFEPFAAFCGSERASMVGGPADRFDAWRRLAAIIGHRPMRGHGFWTVTHEGGPVGRFGLWFPEGWPGPEVGWLPFAQGEGRGIAREAAEAALDHAYGILGWSTAISIVRPENARSIALAMRMGARREAEFDHPTLGALPVWRHPGPVSAESSA